TEPRDEAADDRAQLRLVPARLRTADDSAETACEQPAADRVPAAHDRRVVLRFRGAETQQARAAPEGPELDPVQSRPSAHDAAAESHDLVPVTVTERARAAFRPVDDGPRGVHLLLGAERAVGRPAVRGVPAVKLAPHTDGAAPVPPDRERADRA